MALALFTRQNWFVEELMTKYVTTRPPVGQPMSESTATIPAYIIPKIRRWVYL
jgi:hypothetical protein